MFLAMPPQTAGVLMTLPVAQLLFHASTWLLEE
jgi:hypothetical protein